MTDKKLVLPVVTSNIDDLNAIRATNALIASQVDRNAILAENRELANSMWSGKLKPAELKALNNVCMLYGLDPLQKQVVVLGGNLYVTKSGILNIAHQDENPPEGIEVVPATKQEREDSGVPPLSHYWKAVVYKRGMAKPFIEFGEANTQNVRLHQADWRVISDMAKTRAVNRALRNAYRIGMTSIEEMGYIEGTVTNGGGQSEPKAQTVETKAEPPATGATDRVYNDLNVKSAPTYAPAQNNAPGANLGAQAAVGDNEYITIPQRERMFAIARQNGVTNEALKQYIKEHYNIESTKDITKKDYADLMVWIEGF